MTQYPTRLIEVDLPIKRNSTLIRQPIVRRNATDSNRILRDIQSKENITIYRIGADK